MDGAEPRAARLLPASPPCSRICSSTNDSNRAHLSALKAPSSKRTLPIFFDLSAAHDRMALTRASRLMKSICCASVPNKRLRSPSAVAMRRLLDKVEITESYDFIFAVLKQESKEVTRRRSFRVLLLPL